MVQNAALKTQDVMQEYEELTVSFYGDSHLIRALQENASLKKLLILLCIRRIRHILKKDCTTHLLRNAIF